MFEAFAIFENTLFFLISIILFTVVVGMSSKSFIFASYSGILMFLALATEASFSLFTNVMFIFIVSITIVTSFQLFQLTQENHSGV